MENGPMRGRGTIFKTFFTIESVGVFWLIPCIFIVILVLMNFEACLVGLLGVVFPPLMLWAISEMNIPDYYFGLYCLVQFAGVLLMAGHLYYLGRKIRLRYFEMNWAQREQVRRPKSIGLYFVFALIVRVASGRNGHVDFGNSGCGSYADFALCR